MDVQILTKKENLLLHRLEVMFKAIHKAEPTPTRDALRAFLARELKAQKDHVIVDRARSTFGRYETLGYAKVYKSKDEALAVERHHILVRNKLAEAEAKEAKPGEAAPAAKPEKPAPAPKAEKPAAPKKEEGKPVVKPEAKPAAKAEKALAKEEKKPAPEKPAAEKKEAKKPEAKKAAPKKKEEK